MNEFPLQMKHKKHKHKKHKKKKLLDESEGSQDLSFDDADTSKPALKLKIKFGTETGDKGAGQSSSADKMRDKGSPAKLMDRSGQVGSSPKASKKKKGKGKDSGTSSEEERWLDAIESGKLEEVDDELKKIKPKDPKLMTARQRAMFERKTDKEPSPGGEQLLALPSGYKEKVMTAEAIQKAALKSQKRKQLADEKREKDKKKTMERLLKKQESKSGKSSNRSRSARKQVPRVTYHNTVDGISISLPSGVDFSLHSQTTTEKSVLVPVPCGVEGCTNMKKYCCSKTGLPLCSLECYQKNIATVKN
ncbi:INO80 complex subunit B isoform X2 [Zootermopsis nevadensis]|nr:INO80 complex subunit B isoform X2 [Zootermopsis nevadensis]XP_021917173.1 INO80 complex subunit B isoform X2 [Zootermopsis nevadensis]